MWPVIKIKDLGRVVTGSTPPTNRPENFGSGYHFIKPPDLHKDSRKVFVTNTEISEIGAQTQYNRLLPANTPFVVCIGTIGKLGLTTKPSFTNQQINSVIVDQSRHDPVFVYYLLIFTIVKVKQLNAGSASGRENVNKSTFENIEVCAPVLQEQRRIAGILSAYDELIENSQRRIQLLEKMARALYREWFVQFKFPDHENVKIIDGVPEGWDVKTVKEILKRRPAGKVYRAANVEPEGEVQVIDQSTDELLGFHNDDPGHHASPKAPMAIFGDHTCKMQLLIEPFSIGPNVVPFTATDGLPTTYVFYAVHSLVSTQEYKRHWAPLNAKEIIVADPAITQRFAELIQPILMAQDVLRKSIRNLRQTRDLLLPRLFLGKINFGGD